MLRRRGSGPRVPVLHACVLVSLICGLAPRSQAWEVSFGETARIDNQGPYGYCVYYALANFFELWGNQQHPVVTPALSPGYLAMANNYEWSSGEGQILSWAWLAVARHGVIPKGAWADEFPSGWPRNRWVDDHKSLLSLDELESGLTAEYQHPQVSSSFRAPDYLQYVINIDMTDVRFVQSSHWESMDRGAGARISGKRYRHGSYQRTMDRALRMGEEMGISLDLVTVQPVQLYEAIKYQLYQRRPVLVSVFTGLTKERFGHLNVIGNGQLLPEGQGQAGQHLITAVAHCDRWESGDEICARFAESMQDYNIPECIAYENTWGSGANNSGYVCISAIASKRVLRQAALMKDSLVAVR